MVSAGPLPYACGSERIPFSPPAGPLGLSKNLENPWEINNSGGGQKSIITAAASDLLRLALGSYAWAKKMKRGI